MLQYILLAVVGFGILMWAYANLATAFVFMGKKNKEADLEVKKAADKEAHNQENEEEKKKKQTDQEI